MTVYLEEAIGTMILVILGNGVVANVLLNRTKGQNSGWMVITTGWGLAVTVAVYSVGRISGAHINPAVTFGLASIGAFSWSGLSGSLWEGRRVMPSTPPETWDRALPTLSFRFKGREKRTGDTVGFPCSPRFLGGHFGGMVVFDRGFLTPERK